LDAVDQLTQQGVVVCSLEEGARRFPDLVQQGLASVGVGESKFLSMWNALWRGGCFIHVPASVEASVPVWVAHTASDGAAVFPATVAVLGDNSSLALVDMYASSTDGGQLLSDAVVALAVGRDARLDYGCLQQWGPQAWHMSVHRATLAANAQLRFFCGTFGSRVQKSYWDCYLDGQGSEAALAGICFGDGEQHLDHQSLQAHRAPQTRSDLLLKVAVRDRARSVYSGLIDVEKQAQQTDGYVQNRNLMLSRGAIADSVPRLEIKANDVRCGHGATAGHIDDEQRFYLQSRGVPALEAEQLIVRGFMADALDRISHPGLRQLVADILEEEIAGRAQVGIASTDGAEPDATESRPTEAGRA
ncbi:MAG TPA: Fe-S cluster assembly protein SufD, partial [Candidatus Sulfotelmatobacter sp.]|nr:Fe-S cluster assembly protein SufD [Candidatus Sulfotelmatobacter sp.]